jgi:CRP/FNR family transcriptional regulator
MREVASITHERHFKKGETIYFAGRDDKCLFVIHQGQVKILRITESGKSQVIRLLGPGDFMGELSILNDTPLTDYAQATEDCTMCVIDGGALKSLMKKYPTIALKALEELSARLERAQSQIEHLHHATPEYRLAQAILELSAGRREFQLTLSKGDLASQLGMTQETLSRKLASLQSQGLIALPNQRSITILDRAGLEQVG